jgi:hypothetical protein
MNKINLELRCTNHFSSGWDSLDEWQDVGPAKVLARRNIVQDNEHHTGYNWTERVVVPRATLVRYGARAVEQAISNTLTYSHCRHDHDCCGCVSYSGYAEYKGGREFLVRGCASRNV